MNARETQFNRDDVLAELDARIHHAVGALKGRRGNGRRSLIAWKSALEDYRQSVTEGAITEAQVSALVDQGCRLSGVFPADQVGNRGLHTVWMVTGEAMSNNVAFVQQLGRLLRTQIDGADTSP